MDLLSNEELLVALQNREKPRVSGDDPASIIRDLREQGSTLS